ncbi:hypothetical protein BDQ17DRAFT_1339501 [Cyathus striatus]|nr:hypothetical protein BDQ17DRAFT_1339501 [Cyathus striatus]
MGQFWRLYEILTTLRSVWKSTHSWAGDRITCLGSYAEELSKSVLTSEELAELNAKGHSLVLKIAEEDKTYEIYPVPLQEVLDSMDAEVKVPDEENFDYSNTF